MPVERSRGHAGRALGVSVLTIAILLAGAYAASRWLFGAQSSFDVRLGDQTFQGGNAERLADEIAEGGPILYGDVSDTGTADSRDIILQHIGDDPEEGWYAFLAYPPDQRRDCFWQWQPDEELFRATCDEDLTAPADGEGLLQFPVVVDDGKLDIDLNHERRESTTTTTAPESGDVPDDEDNGGG